MPITNLKIQTGSQRILLIIGAVFFLVVFIFSIKWSIGHTIATRAEQKELAEMSVGLAPDDPRTHLVNAGLLNNSFLSEDLAKAETEYEKAVALSPDDYLLWLALGKAREKNGDAAGAEQALRRSVQLAPNYAAPHWSLGNNLLRQGKTDDAFREIISAADINEVYVMPTIATMWQIFEGDTIKIKQSIGNSKNINAYLAIFLLKQEKLDDAFETWNSLPESLKSGVYVSQSEELYNKFISVGKYHYARQIKSALSGQDPKTIYGSITYGDFESNSKKLKPDFFDWQIADGLQPLIGYDDKVKHGGKLSLVIIFNSPNGVDFRSVLQIIAVEAGKSYSLEGFYKSELKSSATLRWEILNATDRSIIASTEEVKENTDWTNFGANFTVPENAEAVIVNLARVGCKSTICPITGKIWFDDFILRER